MYSTVYITAKDPDEARRIARALVSERLVACANVWPITSVFNWEGAQEESAEAAMICKTRTALVPDVIKRVKALHSYEVPCITSWKIDSGSRDYLDWVDKETG
ncbi:MAG: Divalent-cation tolerance protein CutA [Methanocella sp. PtaU1.Bin125]|nr:MAG: Divalent-cation tolerance protein CutA [Methanocella sp. PtaU1.Bin125]